MTLRSLLIASAFLILNGCQTSDPRLEISRQFDLWKVLGSSTEGQPIYFNECGTGDSVVLVFGCFHGDEQEGGQLVIRLAEMVNLQRADSLKGKVVFIPILNPDGVAKNTRTNTRGVDINRNFPTKNWSPTAAGQRYSPGPAPASESETRLVMDLLDRYKPRLIITVHTALHVINYDGPAKEIAERMSVLNKYRVSASIGYPTPGSFGTYAGIERNIPTITLELPPVSVDEAWEQNREALWEAVRGR